MLIKWKGPKKCPCTNVMHASLCRCRRPMTPLESLRLLGPISSSKCCASLHLSWQPAKIKIKYNYNACPGPYCIAYVILCMVDACLAQLIRACTFLIHVYASEWHHRRRDCCPDYRVDHVGAQSRRFQDWDHKRSRLYCFQASATSNGTRSTPK